MELYTLDRDFLRTDVIDDFNSVIWTERYAAAGDLTLVVPLTKANIKKYPEGVFVSTPASNEVMIVETTEKDSDAGTLKCTGPSLTGFLVNRRLRTSNTSTDRVWKLPGTYVVNPLTMLGRIVKETCVAGGAYTDSGMSVIPNLSLDSAIDDDSSPHRNWQIQWGTVYGITTEIAAQYGAGIKLYLEFARPGYLSLKFLAYYGRDLTRNNPGQPQGKHVVRFSADLDNFAHIKELHSIANYKNYIQTYTSGTVQGSGSAMPSGATPHGFDLRMMDIQLDDLTSFTGDSADLHDLLSDKAERLLKQYKYNRVVDGEAIPNSQIQYGRDYRLGDKVELLALDGDIAPARITEHILAYDSTGERAYPTIEVVVDPPVAGNT